MEVGKVLGDRLWSDRGVSERSTVETGLRQPLEGSVRRLVGLRHALEGCVEVLVESLLLLSVCK